YGIQVEAETGRLSGSARVYQDSAASGGLGVAYISSPGAGFRLENPPVAVGVEIRYASALSGVLSVLTDNVFIGAVAFSATGSWVGLYDSVYFPFPTGIGPGGSFEIVFMNGDTAMNIDFIEFVAPEPEDRGELPEPEVPRASFGIEDRKSIFHVDEGWTARFNYLCINGDCRPGHRENGFFRRNLLGELESGELASIEFKVEDEGGQCLTGAMPIRVEPGVTAVNSPCSTSVLPSPPDSGAPVGPLAPPPLGSSPPEVVEALAGGLISRQGNVITTRLADRFRDRHESDTQHDRYIENYAEGTSYEIILTDRPDALEVQIHSPHTPLSMVNFTHDHIQVPGFVDPPRYRGGGFMSKGSLNGPGNDSADHQVNRLFFEIRSTNGRPWSEVRDDHEVVTLEFTPRRELNGNFPQYYSDIVRYVAGQGGVVLERDDLRYFSGGSTTNFAHGSRGFEFSQPFLGIDEPKLHRFTLGRELFRASFLGDALVGNGGWATGADPEAAASACVDCHFQLGAASPPGRGTSQQQGFIGHGADLRVAPALIGLGLLEAIDETTIEDLAARSGGKVPDGRFGWKATQRSLREQVLVAF
ncbi:MAG: family 31 carbohydrate-binding protein, partial [Myxococcota bacterium]